MRVRRTTLLILGCCAFLFGLWVSMRVTLPPVAILFLVVTTVFFRRNQFLLLLLVLLVGLSCGIVRGNMFLPNVQQYARLNGEKVLIRVVAETDADYDKRKQLSFDASKLELIEPDNALLVGRIKIAGFGESAVYKVDVLFVQGKLYKGDQNKRAYPMRR